MSQSDARRQRREREREIAKTCALGRHLPKTGESKPFCARCGEAL